MKIAVSLPREEFVELEAIRKRAGLSRSAFILEAFRAWKESKRMSAQIRKYQAGYRLRPEAAALAEALAQTATETLPAEEWE